MKRLVTGSYVVIAGMLEYVFINDETHPKTTPLVLTAAWHSGAS